MPFLRKGAPATMFTVLRNKVIREVGFDFLSVFGDMMRPRGLHSTKPGVAERSRHKCGDAFDYNQGEHRLALVREPRKDRMYWRTYLLCPKQDGSQGVPLVISHESIVPSAPGVTAKSYYDFTSTAEALGWHRIPAHDGFEKISTKKEFWHYQLVEGYSFEQAMELLYGDPAKVPVQPEFPDVNPGDHDDQEVNVRHDVRQVQAQLYLLKFLTPLTEVDGGYGPNTTAAVKAFQEASGLPLTGIADEQTRRLLIQKVTE
jgi:hypothetical protein